MIPMMHLNVVLQIFFTSENRERAFKLAISQYVTFENIYHYTFTEYDPQMEIFQVTELAFKSLP